MQCLPIFTSGKLSVEVRNNPVLINLYSKAVIARILKSKFSIPNDVKKRQLDTEYQFASCNIFQCKDATTGTRE